ncbi:MAG: hypothetical protein COB60_10745 [Flavobacteriaceae bacterium]|nr:MAG: hypothetical protein COB60_10745 [Flavobacteriaceae bacterium]
MKSGFKPHKNGVSLKKVKNDNKKSILLIGILVLFISCYNTISGKSIKSNLVGFILGIGFVLRYFELNKLSK